MTGPTVPSEPAEPWRDGMLVGKTSQRAKPGTASVELGGDESAVPSEAVEAMTVTVMQGDRIVFVGQVQQRLGDSLHIEGRVGESRLLIAVVHDMSAAIYDRAPTDGSSSYTEGWQDAIERAVDAVESLSVAVPPEPTEWLCGNCGKPEPGHTYTSSPERGRTVHCPGCRCGNHGAVPEGEQE